MPSKTSADFFQKVYAVAREIPYGRVTSYGAIAKYLGSGRSARMVGWAMNASFNQFQAVPAHRVVNRLGLLSGRHHFGYESQMEEMLEREDIDVANFKVKEFKTLFWDPMEEMPDAAKWLKEKGFEVK